MRKTYSHKIEREEKNSYLSDLNTSLQLLQQRLTNEASGRSYLQRVLQDFGDKNKWDFERIANIHTTHRELGTLVCRIRNEYLWFADVLNHDDTSLNRAYFDGVTINATSGLPWQHDFISLSRLKKEAKKKLLDIPTENELASKYLEINLSDSLPVEEVQNEATKIHTQMLNRNYLEQLDSYPLLSWEPNSFGLTPLVEKRMTLGSESLWNIQFVKYSLAYGFFLCYSIDLWKDINDLEITPESDSRQGTISKNIENLLLGFSERNHAWHVLKELDEKFSYLHPVHVSKAIIGPFENKYRTMPTEDFTMPEIFAEIISEDNNASFLRLNREYSYAPNHVEVNGVLRQVVHSEPWSEEYVVVPAKYSQKVASSILGDGVKIIEK